MAKKSLLDITFISNTNMIMFVVVFELGYRYKSSPRTASFLKARASFFQFPYRKSGINLLDRAEQIENN